MKKPKKRGIFKDALLTDQVADLFYVPNDSLAQMIVDAWTSADVRTLLLQAGNAKAMFAQRGFYWNRDDETPVVIAEHEYFNHYTVSQTRQ